MKVIGIEGRFDPEAPVQWGTPVVELDDGCLLNPVTKFVTDHSEILELQQDNHATIWKKPVPLSQNLGNEAIPKVLLVLKRDSPLIPDLQPKPESVGLVLNYRKRPDFEYFGFAELDDFNLYAQSVTGGIAKRLLNLPSATSQQVPVLLRIGRTLDSKSAVLNAIRVGYAARSGKNIQRLKSSVELTLRSARDRKIFNELFDALVETRGNSAQKVYELYYAGGIVPAGGGLPIDVAARTLRGIERLREYAGTIVQNFYTFLSGGDDAVPLLHQLVPSSAKLRFAINKEEDTTVGQQVSSYLQLKTLQRLLEQDLDVETVRQQEALHDVLVLGAGTTLKHTPIGDSHEQILSYQEKTVNEETRHFRYKILGYISGAKKVGEGLEICIFPGKETLIVSTSDNGDGVPPIGIDNILRDGAFLCRVAVFDILHLVSKTIRRDNTQSIQEREAFHLRSVRILLEGETATVDSVPSSIIRGSRLQNTKLEISRVSDDEIEVQRHRLNGRTSVVRMLGLSTTNYEGASNWLNDYALICHLVELDSIRRGSASWSHNAKVKLGNRHEILLALHALGGEAHIMDIAKFIAKNMHHPTITAKNVRRDVNYRMRDVASIDRTDKRVANLTPLGELHAKALSMMGIISL